MDESTYQHLADAALRRVQDALEDVDAEDVDCERAGDVLTLTFKNKKRCILNTQRPTRQLWLAANARAWHFDWDAAAERWIDDKDHATDLFERVGAIIRETSGIDVRI